MESQVINNDTLIPIDFYWTLKQSAVYSEASGCILELDEFDTSRQSLWINSILGIKACQMNTHRAWKSYRPLCEVTLDRVVSSVGLLANREKNSCCAKNMNFEFFHKQEEIEGDVICWLALLGLRIRNFELNL